MGTVNYIKASRKSWTCDKCGKPINPGDSYYRGEVNFGPVFVRCTSCKLESWEVTSSDYQREIGRIQNKWTELFPLSDETPEAISESLRDIQDEVQEKFDNVPENLQDSQVGQLLQDRIDGLESAIDALDLIDIDELKSDAVDNTLDTYEEFDNIEYPEYDTLVADESFNSDIKGEIIEAYENALASEIESALDELDW